MTPSLPLAFILVVLGVLLMGAEMFVPAFKVLFAVGMACAALGLAITFYVSPAVGLYTLFAVFLAVPTVLGLGMHYGPRTPLGRRLYMNAPDQEATVATMPKNKELESLRGRLGRTLGALRPAGVVDFDGRRVDTISEGTLVDADVWVRCIDVRAGKVIVRPVDKPDLGRLETMDFT